MDTELEGIGQPEFVYGEGNDAQVLVEFLLELREISDEIDPFVEPSSGFLGRSFGSVCVPRQSSPRSGTALQGFAERRSRPLRFR